MKRYISLLLAAVMALTMTACGGRSDTDTEDIGGTVRPGVTENTGTGTVQPGTDDETQDGFEPGSVSGGVYANEFAGIGCKLDDSWVFYTQEQMAELNGVLTEGTDSEDVKAMLADSPSIFDMYAVSTDGLMTMNVVFQNLGLLGGAAVSAQDYVELSAGELGDTLSAYGYENVAVQVSAADAVVCMAGTMAATMQTASRMLKIRFFIYLSSFAAAFGLYFITKSSRVSFSVSIWDFI